MDKLQGYRLSPQQERLWGLSGRGPHSSRLAMLIRGALQVSEIRRALERVVARHGIFRTGFRREPGTRLPLQVVGEEARFRWEHREAAIAGDPTQWDAFFETGTHSEPEDGVPLSALLRGDEARRLLVLELPALHADWQTLFNLFHELAEEITGLAETAASREIVQYCNFSEWQHALRGEPSAREGTRFWSRHLPERPADLRLPFESPSGEGGALGFFRQSLGADRSAGEDRAIACWYALLYRLSEQAQFCVQSVHHGRIFDELEHGMGLYATMVPLWLTVSMDTTLDALIERIRVLRADALTYLPYIPWGQTLAATKGFDFEFLQTPRTHHVGGLAVSFRHGSVVQNDFKLRLTLTLGEDGLALELAYDTGLFPAIWIERMAGIYRILLERGRGDQRLDALALLDERQREQLVRVFNRTEKAGVLEPVHCVFENRAERAPDRTAILHGQAFRTYDRLNLEANRLAALLMERGVNAEVPVGLCLRRSPVWVQAVLAVLKAGGAYVPMDPDYPRPRLLAMLENVAVLISETAEPDWLPKSDIVAIPAAGISALSAGRSGRNPGRGVSPLQTAYAIYTSGSTGAPKGVLISHRGLANYLDWCGRAYEVARGGGAPVHGSLCFDMAVTSVFAPLLAGQAIDLVPEEEGFEGLTRVLQTRGGFSFLKLTPSHLKMPNGWREQAGSGIGAKLLVLGGEALAGEDLAPWQEGPRSMRFFNEYGPTEATVGCVVHEMTGKRSGRVPIGTPIQNSRAYLLDRQDRPLPFGVKGELYLAGVCLARGYLNRPQATAERFLPDPFSAEPGTRMYRTGDWARFLGSERPVLEFLGRSDQQIKIRGYRLEPAEIEHALRGSPEVAQAVVLPHGEGDDRRLVAYVQPGSESGSGKTTAREIAAEPSEKNRGLHERLRAYLLERLPEYMIPNTFLTVAAMPLTPNGKVDVARLPEPDRNRPDLARAFVPPGDALETALAGVWQRTLSLDRVGVHDNFFSLGGDSIRSVRAVALAREEGIHFTMQQLFLFPNIRDLAAELRTAGEEGRPGSGDGIVTAEAFSLISPEDRAKLSEGIEDAYPLCENQKGMLFHMETRSDSAPIYHNVNSFELAMRFDLECYERAANIAIARHPALRTSFDLTRYSEPLQLVHEEVRFSVTCDDLRHLRPAEQKSVIDTYLESENYRLIDLSKPPLMRNHFHILGENRVKFTLTEPHAISDGWSTHLTHVEIFEIYSALLEGKTPPQAEPIPIGFRDFVKLEREAYRSESSEKYWVEQLAGAKPTRLPRLPSEIGVDAKGHKLFQAYESSLAMRLNSLSKTLEVPLKCLVLAAHLKVMSMAAGEEDTLTGVTYNGRPEVPGGDRVRGLFLNTVPFRLALPRGSWTDLVKAVYRAEAALLPHRLYPLPALQRMWGKRLLFEVGFNYIHFHAVAPMLESGQVEYLGGEDLSRTNFPFAVSFMLSPVAEDYLRVVFQYDATLFPPQQIHALNLYYRNALEAMVSEPDGAHGRASLLPPQERHRQLVSWNQSDGPVPELGMQQMIEACASARPHATAVVLGRESLTYGALSIRAGQVARRLRALGVGPDLIVGLFMERSPAMIVSLLGILKAGGAYLPLDPTYPAARIDHMLSDSGAQVVITTKALSGDLPTFLGMLLTVDTLDNGLAEEGVKRLEHSPVLPENLAYVIYTSGSTGQPKGVLVPHRGWCNLARHQARVFEVVPTSRILQFASLSFDASAWEIVMALGAGAALFLAESGTLLAGAALADCLRSGFITHVTLPPSALTQFPDREFPALRVMVVAGEACPPELAAKFSQSAAFFNAYGPTETTVCATIYPCPSGSDRKPPIGRPISNVQCYVLDRQLQPPPTGTAGDLFIAGIPLTRGYHGQWKLTAEKLIPNPFAERPGMRLYRSGDLVRYLFDGNIDFLGRGDHQVKLRGFRIELGEIESLLASHPMVEGAVVLAREDSLSNKRLVGYLRLSGNSPKVSGGPVQAGPELTVELRDFLRANLPNYMVPAKFVVLDEFPLTPSGKIDGNALPDPDRDAASAARPYRAPVTDMERRLAEIWAEVLETGRVGLDDNFFELGGDSILCLNLVSKAQRAWIQVTMDQVFQHPTVEALAKIAEGGEPVKAEQGVVTGMVPLTPRQYGLIACGAGAFCLVFRVGESLDPTLLKQAVDALLFHHDALRLRFVRKDGSWRQVIADLSETSRFSQEDLSSFAAEKRAAAFSERAGEWISTLDLERGPVFRVVLCEMGAGEPRRLAIVSHPLVMDSPSVALLVSDLDRSYRQLGRGERIALPAKTISFKTWAIRLRERARDREFQEVEESFWSGKAGLPVQPLPGDTPGSDSGSGCREMWLSAEETACLLDRGSESDIETVLLACLAAVLREWAGSSAVCVELETRSGTALFPELDFSRTLGPMSEAVPLYLRLGEDSDPAAAFRETRAEMRALSHRGPGLGMLRYLSGNHASNAAIERLPRAQAGWRYLGRITGGTGKPIAEAGPETLAGTDWRTAGGLPLELSAFLFEERLGAVWRYDRALFEERTVLARAEQWLETVRALLRDAGTGTDPGPKPEDFSDVDLNQEELDELLKQYGHFEA